MSQTDERATRIEAATAFLSLLARGAPKSGVLALTARMREEGGEQHFTSVFFTVEEIAAAAKWAISFCDRKEVDVYARCSLLREKPKAGRGKKVDTLGASVLWVDLDGEQEEILARLEAYPRPPSHIHNSGHGIHAFWSLERFQTETKDVEGRNRGLIRDLGGDLADHSWDITRVLRIPGTRNYKGGEALSVEALESTGVEYPMLVFPLLAAPERTTSTEGLAPEPLPTGFLEKLPKKLRELIVDGKGGATKGDGEANRSANYWAIARALLQLGYSPNICVSVLCHPTWSSGEKARERGEASNALLTVARATEDAPEYRPTFEEQRGELQAWTGSEFMSAEFVPARWQVENIWLDRNIGFIAGEPKTFKTWLALDLGLSIASGRPFLNRYPVLRPSPVALIQREDPPGYLQDRLHKIAIAKGLGGFSSVSDDGRKVVLTLPPPFPPLYVWTDPSFQLSDEDSVTRLNEWLESKGARNLGAMVFDPLLKVAFGFDEFKASEVMARVFQPSELLRNRWGASIIIVHHESKSSEKSRGGQRMYGSMALHAFAESALYLKRTGVEEVSVTSEYKSESAPPFAIRFPDLREAYKPELGTIKFTILPLMEYLSSLDHPISATEIAEHFQLSEGEVARVITRAVQRGSLATIPGARRHGEPNKYRVAEEAKE